LEPDNLVHYGGLAQLKYEQAQLAISKGEKQIALITIDEARTFLAKGLNLDRNNEVLLSIQHAVDEFERDVGRK
jgi:hypothetical protein